MDRIVSRFADHLERYLAASAWKGFVRTLQRMHRYRRIRWTTCENGGFVKCSLANRNFRIAEVVNEIAHHKEKEMCLAQNIQCEERELDEQHERAVSVREDVNKLHLMLRDLRRTYDEKRRDAGLLMAQ